ncbi:ArgP/LysG family DNA-binding transcriptional regulator [Arthrobacter tumbae]|uniref:LysR family transcriptional regulator ArgP n=1 Tax=Arthrobacter tumbae TaxID=163874 RepID=UPI00195C9859|nr:LysR family transcriptional regulator ArgP [Arthrobacter tumbae]MBM7782582.1 LysR family transcriptional regulator (chromosome initiation inhibitor) [Arthrobacter tumbae]
MQFEQLRALAAIIDEESFEAAADLLRITPSAVSQRIKALEASVGQIVVRRGTPCTATDAGSVLLRMARQLQIIEAETRSALGHGEAVRTVTQIAVNADSLATWFVPILSEAAGWVDTTLDLRVEDQDHSSRLLRQGDVIGAITSDPAPVNGCRSELLGFMRYLPVATPALQRRFRNDDGADFTRMPVLQFNAKDDLQQRFLQTHGVSQPPPRHLIPSSEAFIAALRAGLGWGMIPELQLESDLDDGTLVLLEKDAHVDVPLHWQTWTLNSERLNRMTGAVREAGRYLRPPR